MNKKLLFTLCGLLPLCVTASQMPVLDFDPPPRSIKMNPAKSITLTGKNFEIVVPDDAGKPAKFAGKEMQSLLNEVLSAKIPLRNTRTKGVAYGIILGDSALSREAGIRVEKLGRDAFYMKTIGNNIYIAGRDDKASDTEKLLNDRSWKTQPFLHLRGTLFGAYDFVERFAGVRFYFVGPIGTYIPKKSALNVPELNIFDRPDNIVRFFLERRYSKKQWYLNEDPIRSCNLASLRMRTQTRNIPNCHGLACLGLVSRFGKSNPEFFALKKDGTRYNTFDTDFAGQLCLTNPGLRNELIKDILSGLRGEPHTVRGITSSSRRYPKGIPHWSANTLNYPGFFNVHLQDACQPCLCDACQKFYNTGKKGVISGELIWDMTADMANRVKKAGIKAYITQMAYHFYKEVPKLDLPDNVLVQVALPGPWTSRNAKLDKYDRDLIAAWHKKINKKVWLWNYIINGDTHASLHFTPGAPQYTPKTIAKYYQARSKDICGAFMQNNSGTNYILDAINLYVGMKVLWDTSLDVEKLLDEYYQNMFQAAAPEMKKFFEELEEIFVTKVRSEYVDTDLGPVAVRPTDFETWKKIYTPEKLAAWDKLFRKAESKVAKNKPALERVRYMRKNFLSFMQEKSQKFFAQEKRTNNLSACIPEGKEQVIYLSRLRGKKTEIKANVKLRNDGKALVIDFRADDPKTGELVYNPKKGDLKDFFSNATFEIFLNPTCDRRTIYQIAISPANTLYSTQYPGYKKWGNGKIQSQTTVAQDHWTASVRIPLELLPGLDKNGFPANFTYNRQRKNAGDSPDHYSWSPWLQFKFLEVDNFGKISFVPQKNDNLILDFDFTGLKKKGIRANVGAWRLFNPRTPNDIMEFSSEYFITGGQSVKGVGTTAKSRVSFDQPIIGKLKSNTKYRLSYYVRYDLDKNAAMYNLIHIGVNNFIPRSGLKGKRDWIMVTGEFKTKNLTEQQKQKGIHVSFALHGKGVFYVDHVVLEEIK